VCVCVCVCVSFIWGYKDSPWASSWKSTRPAWGNKAVNTTQKYRVQWIIATWSPLQPKVHVINTLTILPIPPPPCFSSSQYIHWPPSPLASFLFTLLGTKARNLHMLRANIPVWNYTSISPHTPLSNMLAAFYGNSPECILNLIPFAQRQGDSFLANIVFHYLIFTARTNHNSPCDGQMTML